MLRGNNPGIILQHHSNPWSKVQTTVQCSPASHRPFSSVSVPGSVRLPLPSLSSLARKRREREESSRDLASIPDTSRRLTGLCSSTCPVQCDYNPEIQIY